MTDGGSTISPPADGAAALAVTLEWLRELDCTDESGAPALQPLDMSGAPGTLSERLAAAGLRDWHDAIVAAADRGHPLHLAPPLGLANRQGRR